MIKYTEKGYGLHKLIKESGYKLYQSSNGWVSSNDIEVQNIIDNYDGLTYEKSKATDRIKKQTESILQSIEDEYPSYEKQTWAYQRLEAEAWALDNNAITPNIDQIAQARGIDRVTQIQRTLIKAADFALLVNTILGKRQKLEDEIESSADVEYISSINFEL